MTVSLETLAWTAIFLKLLSWPYNVMISKCFSSMIIFNVFKLQHAHCITCKPWSGNAELTLICNILKKLTGGHSFDHLIFTFFIIICIIFFVFAVIWYFDVYMHILLIHFFILHSLPFY